MTADFTVREPSFVVCGERGRIGIAVAGTFDAEAGRVLLDLVHSAHTGGAAGVDVDLDGVSSIDDDGAEAIAACARWARTMNPGWLVFQATGPEGRRALLETATR